MSSTWIRALKIYNQERNSNGKEGYVIPRRNTVAYDVVKDIQSELAPLPKMPRVKSAKAQAKAQAKALAKAKAKEEKAKLKELLKQQKRQEKELLKQQKKQAKEALKATKKPRKNYKVERFWREQLEDARKKKADKFINELRLQTFGDPKKKKFTDKERMEQYQRNNMQIALPDINYD